MKIMKWLVVFVACVPLFAAHGASISNDYFEMTASSESFEGDAYGRSYVSVGSRLFAIGGRLSDGMLSDEVQVLERDGAGFKLLRAQLSEPVAFAGAAVDGGAIYLAGGLRTNGISSGVVKLEWKDDAIVETELLSLPEPRLLSAVAMHRGYLYVLGGLASLESMTAADTSYSLWLNQEGQGWNEEPPMPAIARIGSIAQNMLEEIVVVGGWEVSERDGRAWLTPAAATWSYSRIPRDGHITPGWEPRSDLAQAVADAPWAMTGQAHLTIAGGDAAPGFLDDFLTGTKMRDPVDAVLAFHDPTSTWFELGRLPAASFGGAMAKLGEKDFLFAGSRDVGGKAVAGALAFKGSTRSLRLLDYIAIAVYFVVIAGIGAYFARKQTSAEEFALGNRKVKWWAAGISMMASGVSTISFMAIPAMVACKGLANSGSAIMILVFAPFAAFVTYPLLRRLRITSTFEYLERRYGLPLRLIGSGSGILVGMMGRVGIVILLPALAISAVTNINPLWACIALGIVTTLYSTFGGYEAVVWTDVVQGVLMLVGFAMIGILAFLSIDGGASALWQYGHELDRWNLFITKFDVATPMIWFSFIGMVIQQMSFASDQGTAQRVLSTPMKDVRKLAFLAAAFGTLVAYMAAAVGMSLFGYFKSSPEMLNPIMKNDQMVPLFIIQKMPAGIAGLMIAVLFAASMSTVSTAINGASVNFGEDFVKRFKKNITSKGEMRSMQVLSFIAGLMGTGMAIILLYSQMPTLFEGFVKIMALIGGGFVGVYSLGMFTRRANLPGAVIGVIASYIVAWLIKLYTVAIPIHWSAWGLFTTLSCILFGYIFSLIIPYRNNDLTGLTVWDQLTDEEAEARLKNEE